LSPETEQVCYGANSAHYGTKRINMRKSKKYSQKMVFRKKIVSLPKTKFRVRSVATRLEHRRVEGKRNK